jgi:hypothetical protein
MEGNKHTKSHSISIVTRKMCIKTAMRHHNTIPRVAKIKKKIPKASKNAEQLQFSYTAKNAN